MKCVIFGATGTLGKAFLTQLVKSDSWSEILCISRGEHVQKQVAALYKDYDQVKFQIGDIRERDTVRRACVGAHTVFLFAALKHIDVVEANPEEGVKTNVNGTINVSDAATECGAKYVVFSSTDKAVDPINIYGMTKCIAESILMNRNKSQSETKFCVYRWGNIVGSQGSAIPLFKKQIESNSAVDVTDMAMTRYWITVEKAVEFVLTTYRTCDRFKVNIPPMKAASISKVLDCVAHLAGTHKYSTRLMGARPGEKTHESIQPNHIDPSANSFTCEQYSDSELKELISGALFK